MSPLSGIFTSVPCCKIHCNPTFQRTNGALKTTNSSRMTVDPEGYLHFSNVTKKDNSDEFLYACSASSGFRNEIKLGNRVFLQVRRFL